MVDLLATTPGRAGSAWRRRARIEVGRDADLVLFDPAARRTIRAADLHHTSDYTPYEGLESPVPSVTSSSAASRSSATARSSAAAAPGPSSSAPIGA